MGLAYDVFGYKDVFGIVGGVIIPIIHMAQSVAFAEIRIYGTGAQHVFLLAFGAFADDFNGCVTFGFDVAVLGGVFIGVFFTISGYVGDFDAAGFTNEFVVRDEKFVIAGFTDVVFFVFIKGIYGLEYVGVNSGLMNITFELVVK